MTLSERSDDELLSNIVNLVGAHRELTAKLVAHLAEIEERRLHLLAGFSSMFEFCTKKLGFSEGEAFRRILAARLGRRFPVVHSLLASGRVNLSTLELLRELLTDENHEELFAAVAGMRKLEVQAVLARRFPRPERPSTIRRQGKIEALSETSYLVEFTAGDELRRKLELCRDLMSHTNPSRNLAVVIERAVDLLLSDLERKRLGTAKRPRREPQARELNNRPPRELREDRGETASAPSSIARPRVTNAARREVFERDGLQCTYVAEDGRRCEARAFLELDHATPKAVGGSSDSENLRVRCRAHNQLWAEQSFGREKVERARHFCQQKWSRRRVESNPRVEAKTAPPETTVIAIVEKVHFALRKMGFRDAEARHAIAEVMKHDCGEPLDVVQALRKALFIATAA